MESGGVGIECLYPRMKFRAGQSQFLDSALDFFNRCLSFMGVNTGKTDKLLWIALHNGCNIIIPQRGQTGGGFRIPGQQDTNHIEFRIIGGYLLDILQFHLGTEEAFGGLGVGAERDLHKLRCRQVDMKVDGAWHGMFLHPFF